MPLFTYRALNNKNQIVESKSISTSSHELATELESKGLTPISINLDSRRQKTSASLPLVEKMTFCRYTATMLKSGLSITESINVLQEEVSNPTMKQILEDINSGIQHGENLSDILSRHPNTFDNFFITIIKAGEVSGTLAQSFSQIEHELKAEYNLRQKISGALLYPAVVFVAMFGIGILMFFFIMPQIGQVFLNLKMKLPAPLEIMFRLTIVLSKVKFYILAGLAVFIVLLIVFFRSKPGQKLTIAIFSATPIVKNLIKQMDVARFCRTFSTLIVGGVAITQALEISLGSLSYSKYKNSAQNIVDQVTKGQSVSLAFKTNKIFPTVLTQMIASGEKSGALDETLGDLGEFYEEEVETAVKKLTQILEPILMLLVGIGVGVMVLSVIVPIYSVVNNIQGIS